MTDETVGDVIVTETSRQAVILVFSLIGTALMLYVVYELGKPDAFREMKAKGALWLKRYAQDRVDWWQTVADNAATIYNTERY